MWKDGLRAALEILEDDFNITYFNLADEQDIDRHFDVCLGWGAFKSSVDQIIRSGYFDADKYALCIAGNTFPLEGDKYDTLFYETKWYAPQIAHHPHTVHAFGTNTKIYKPLEIKKAFDWITVGAFANWKRQTYLTAKEGAKIAIGEIQKGNPVESYAIITQLLSRGVAVMDMVPPEELAKFYNLSKKCYIPANINGGGERAVLEARACGLEVEVESDNPKLQELIESQIYDQKYYAQQLKKGIC